MRKLINESLEKATHGKTFDLQDRSEEEIKQLKEEYSREFPGYQVMYIPASVMIRKFLTQEEYQELKGKDESI